MKAVVRPYHRQDVHQCMQIAKTFQENSTFSKSGWNNEKFFSLSNYALQDDSDVFAYVVDIDSRVIGAFVGNISEYYFSNEKLAQDLVVIFLPEYKKDSHMYLDIIIPKFEEWAKSKGAVETCILSSTALKRNIYKDYLKSKDYKDVGFIMKKEI